MFLVSVHERDAVVNQLCSVIVPPIFLYIGLLSFFGGKLANWLLRKDTYSEKKIRIRIYGIIKMIGIILSLLLIIVYFAFYRVWDMVIIFVVLLSGCVWIKFRTYSARLEYTYRYLIFCTGKKREMFPWKDVMQMSWRTSRGSVAYSLNIKFRSGLTAELSSNDFVGLTKLKSFYDEGHYKN